MNLGMRWTGMVALLIMLAGCSKASDPNDPASQYNDTDWVAESKGIELHLGDGDATLINHMTGKSADLTYTVDAEGNVLLAGEVFKNPLPLVPDGGGRLINRMKDLSFRKKTDGDDAALKARETERENAEAARSADRPASLDGYNELAGSEFMLLFASRMPELTDTEIAESFIPGYYEEQDAFKKQELLQAQLPAIKSRLAELAKFKDFKLKIVDWESMTKNMNEWRDAKFSYLAVEPYDMSNQTFLFGGNFSPCALGSGGPKVSIEDLMEYTFREWGKYKSDACQIKVADQAVAKEIEAARANSRLAAGATLYVRFTGEQASSNRWIFDAHRMDVTLYLRDLGTDQMSPLGGPYTLTYE